MTTQHGGPGAPSPGQGPTQPPAGPLTAAARDLLDGLDAARLEEHVRVYGELHDRLAGALADPGALADAGAPPPAGAVRPGPHAANPAARPGPARRGG